jgi:hypothetical protein
MELKEQCEDYKTPQISIIVNYVFITLTDQFKNERYTGIFF